VVDRLPVVVRHCCREQRGRIRLLWLLPLSSLLSGQLY
jgi:hypothetical protein